MKESIVQPLLRGYYTMIVRLTLGEMERAYNFNADIRRMIKEFVI